MSELQRDAATRVVRDEMHTRATPEQVYAAWADPERLAQWFVDAARGEARVGATMTWVWDAFGLEAPYEVVTADPARRLVLRTPEHVAPPGVIDITIRTAQGQTVLTLVNSGFLDGAEWDELFEGVRSGWAMALALLREYLERHYGRPKRSFVHMRPSPLPWGELQTWFSDEEHLARWLTTSGAPRTGAASFPLVLRDGTRVAARVIARTERELMLSLVDVDAVLELKAFSAPATADRMAPAQLQSATALTRIVCIRGSVWSEDAGRFEWLRELCGAALDRLVDAA